MEFTNVKYNNVQNHVSSMKCSYLEWMAGDGWFWQLLLSIDELCVTVGGVRKFNRLYVFEFFWTSSANFFNSIVLILYHDYLL